MKKILATLLLGTAVAVAALPVSAQSADSMVTLTADGSAAAVHLNLPEEQSRGVTALQMSFEVESSDSIQVEFVFDDSLTSSVQEYTYNEQTGVMNVYLAGRSELLADGSADLGEIRMEGNDGSQASVRFVADSLKLVDASLGKSEPAVASNGEVNLSVGSVSVPTPTPEATAKPEATPKPESTPKPETTPAPETTPSPTATPSGGSTSGSSDQGGSSQDQSSNAGTGSSTAQSQSGAQSTATSDKVTSSRPSTGTSGSKKPSSSSTATPSPSASPAPETETQTQATPAPSAEPQTPTETATPEQSLSEQDGGFRLPVVPVAIVVCVVVAAVIGVAIIRFRS